MSFCGVDMLTTLIILEGTVLTCGHFSRRGYHVFLQGKMMVMFLSAKKPEIHHSTSCLALFNPLLKLCELKIKKEIKTEISLFRNSNEIQTTCLSGLNTSKI